MNEEVKAIVEEGKPETVGVSGNGEGKPETVGVGDVQGSASKGKKKQGGSGSRTCSFVQYLKNPETGETLIDVESVRNVLMGNGGKPKYAGIAMWAYILHDKDHRRQADVEKFNAGEIKKQNEDPSYEIKPCPYAVGDAVAPHIHCVVSGYSETYRPGDRVSAMRTESVAKWFHIPVAAVELTRKDKDSNPPKGLDGVALALAYLVHDPRLGEKVAGKHVYDWSEVVTNIKDPQKLVDDYFAKQSTKDHRAAINHILRSVTLGKMTNHDAKREMLSWGEDGSWETWKKRVFDARNDFLSDCPPPPLRINFYIEGRPGTGKTFLASTLANILAKRLYPNILTDDERAFTIDGNNVSFEGYDGQPVIIWDDCRGKAITAILGGRGNVFRAFDCHPKKMRVNKKFGSLCLVNPVNIVTAPQPFESFLRQLSGVDELMEDGDEADMDQMEQAERRFPIWVKVDKEHVEAYYQSGYMGEEFEGVIKILSWGQNLKKLALTAMANDEKEKVVARGCAPVINGEHGIETMIDTQKKKQDGEHYEYQSAEEYWEKNNVPDPVVPCEFVNNDKAVDAEFWQEVKRLPLEVSAVYGKHPEAWVEDHPDEKDDVMLVSADYFAVQNYRKQLAIQDGKGCGEHGSKLPDNKENVGGRYVDADPNRPRMTVFSA